MQWAACIRVHRSHQHLHQLPWAGSSSRSSSSATIPGRPVGHRPRAAGAETPPPPPPQQQQQPQQAGASPQQSQAQPWAAPLQQPLRLDQQQGQQQGGSRVSMWDYKPAWCQPWSILLTGSGAVAGSWQLAHTPWLTAPVALAVAAWWGLFLVVVPASFDRYVEAAERQGIDWRREMKGGE